MPQLGVLNLRGKVATVPQRQMAVEANGGQPRFVDVSQADYARQLGQYAARGCQYDGWIRYHRGLPWIPLPEME